jgi:alkylresorcinol/alkylpyrone synthase
VSRYIRAIYTPAVGAKFSNQALLDLIAQRFETLQAEDAEKESLFDFVRLLLIGHRNRYSLTEGFLRFDSFAAHAAAFEKCIEESIHAIADRIEATPPPAPFDAVFGVTSEGAILPGIAERTSRRLGRLARRTATQMDFGNGGCTASVRAIQLVNDLGPAFRNVLVVAIEPTSTLVDPRSTVRANWQGICTFGDGAAAVWISDEPGESSLELGQMASWRGDAADLIRWDWGTDYYRFGIAELEQFEVQVRSQVLQAMTALQIDKGPEAAWAIHPAGIMLLLSLAKKLGLGRSTLEPSLSHFRSFSNMSSVSILHILENLIRCAKAGQSIRWLSMGAGFHVACGRGVRL